MRTYYQLTRVERDRAILKALEELVDCTAYGGITFGQNLQHKIDLAIKRANDSNMPWGRQEHIMEIAGYQLKRIAMDVAQSARYRDDGNFLKDHEL